MSAPIREHHAIRSRLFKSDPKYNFDAECLRQSLERENQEKAKVYIDEKGVLRAIVPLFVPADPGVVQADLMVSDKNVNAEIKKKVNRPEKIWFSYGTGAVGESWQATSSGVANEVVEIKYELLRMDGIQIFAQITGFDEDHRQIWSYTTPQFEETELPRISEIGPRQDAYYFVQDGTVVALDTQTGEILRENNDFGGSGTDFDFDENAIYLCGAYGPDFYAVTYAGKTLDRIESFDSEYSGASCVQRFDNQAVVLLHTGPEGYLGDEMKRFYINLENIEHLSAKDISEEPFGKSGPFTEEQLEQISKSLGVPDDLQVEIVQEEPDFWNNGLTWEIYVSVQLDGREIAGATIDPVTLEWLRHMWPFNEQNLCS